MPARIRSASLPSSKPRPCRAVRSLLCGLGLANLLSLCSLLASVPSAQAQSLQAGDVLLVNQQGGNVQRYSASGTLETTYNAASGDFVEGVTTSPDGNVVATFATPTDIHGHSDVGIDIFHPDGTLLTSFLTPAVGFPADVSVFADGTLAINGALNGVVLYDQSSHLQKIVSLPFASSPYGSTIGFDNTLWVTDEESDRLFHVNESGTLLGNYSLGFQPGDVVVDPTDGSLWLANSPVSQVVHINALTSTTFSTLGSFNVQVPGLFNGLGISPDGSTLFATAGSSPDIQAYNTSGKRLSFLPITDPNGPLFLTVVPGATAPEPGSLTLVGVGCSVLGVGIKVRRRPNR